MTTGEKIAKLRKQHNMSQEAFSERLNVSRQAVSKWENGTAQPTSENLSQIAKLFDVSVSYLLDEEVVNMDTTNTDYVEESVSTPSANNREEKSFKRGVFLQGIAIIILGITNIIQGSMLGSMKNDIAQLRRRESNYSYLQSQIAMLENRVNYTPAPSNENFTDYSYKVIAYDRQTNTATIQFSVVPKDYSASTTAEIIVKGDKVYNLETSFENNIFTAQADIVCENEMTVYLYLTDNGQTRSFVLGTLPNIARNYRLETYIDYVGGNWRLHDGDFKGQIQVNCTVYHMVSQSIEDCIYPQKAVINLYHHDKLIHQQPFTSIMDYDFVEDAKISSDGVAEIFSNVATFYEYFHMETSGENIADAADITVEVVLTDNNGYEYVITKPLTNKI